MDYQASPLPLFFNKLQQTVRESLQDKEIQALR
jgi:hypothetical protein